MAQKLDPKGFHKEIFRLKHRKEEDLKKLSDEFMATGGYSKKMIVSYLVILISDIALGWVFFPIKLWLALLCYLLSLPLFFLYRYAQYVDKIFKGATTPQFYWQKSSRLGFVIVFLSLLGLSGWLAYPFVKSLLNSLHL